MSIMWLLPESDRLTDDVGTMGLQLTTNISIPFILQRCFTLQEFQIHVSYTSIYICTITLLSNTFTQRSY